MTNVALTAAEGKGDAVLVTFPSLIPRTLYTYVNRGYDSPGVLARDLYVYENRGAAVFLASRSLYVYENRQFVAVAGARSLYLYEAIRDGEVFPWLMRISPTEQFRGGQIDLFGDGFGEFLEVGAGSTITASSTNGGNVPGNAVDRTALDWISNDGAAAWLRLTFSGARVVTGITLEDRAGGANRWGVPEFRFSDGGANINGAIAVPLPAATAPEYPVGLARQHYTLPAPRTTTYVEIRVASGGAGTNRGLGEVWVWADSDDAAESSEAISNLGLAAESHFGIVAWSNRSPGLYPANGGAPITKAATVTVGVAAESGVVVVRESI